MSYEQLADLIFPEITTTISDLEIRFPQRNLNDGAEVLRFAPSPTGFLHTGSLFTAFLGQKVARQTGGVFFVRLEDTDQKREISGTGVELLSQLAKFGVFPHEGYLGDHESGNYGPYAQSKRANIYKTVIKQMINDNIAYPCFCSTDKLQQMRAVQEANKEVTGYYGHYATCSHLSAAEMIEKINNGEPYVIRFRSHGNHNKMVKVVDLVRGELELSENDQHIVILKSDGLPTYHFAHVVDDHFMHTTIVSRGEEWISSLPLHVQMFAALNWVSPKYAHLPVINKLENGNKRKLSKRKDPEAAVSYFLDLGYAPEAVLTYLLSIANSNFEEWWTTNKSSSLDDFDFSFAKMSLDGALFDLEKVNFFAREFFATLTATQMAERVVDFLELSDKNQPVLKLIKADTPKFIEIMNIEREKENPRKDYMYLEQVWPSISFFYESYYLELFKQNLNDTFNESVDRVTLSNVLNDLKTLMVYAATNEEWFESIKVIASKNDFALSKKEIKQNPDKFKGTVADVAEILRISLTGSKKSPNLHDVIKILKKAEVDQRINFIIANFIR
ncbi:MAG TPA: glutamate--tRNA ligase [Bacilli bacterium]|nr:glutamate--tRNA ligase [Bacilli bacterium]